MSNVRPLVLGWALALAPLLPASAQGPFWQAPGPFEGVVTFDAYLSRHNLSFANFEGRPEGTGLRVMAPLGSADGARRERLTEHLSIGGSIELARETRPGTSARLRQEVYAAEVEARPLRAPLAGRIEPLVGLAAGMIRLEEQNYRPAMLTAAPAPYTTTRMSEHALIAPSAGLLFKATRNVGLRFDVRELMTTSSRKSSSTQMATGVRLSW